MQKVITDELDALLDVLPPHIRQAIIEQPDNSELLEIVLDLGRLPEARYPQKEVVLSNTEVTLPDIEHVVSRIGSFSGDNRAGIERTLHRISAIRNREGRIVGLTCRVGRAVFGTVKIIQDLVETGKSVLLLGRPGIGKTTMLREIARVLADDFNKRVIVVDTSNEIAGDGDIPHPGIGHARRMQVPTPTMQHAVMIEAVENHMPEVIIIDEIGTSLEAEAARTIAERGVQLIGTAHGNTLENLMMNPTLSDLVGGIQSVTLGDEEARRRHTQKSILERKAPPTFDIVVEIQERDRVIVHPDVAKAVDAILHNRPQETEVRWVDDNGEIRREKVTTPHTTHKKEIIPGRETPRIYLFGINRVKLEEAAREKGIALQFVSDLKESNMLLTTKNYYRRKPQKVRDAEIYGIPIYAVKSNNLPQLRQCLDNIYASQKDASMSSAIEEAENAIIQVKEGKGSVELSPQNAYIRRLQHLLAERHSLFSRSLGKEPRRRVKILKG
ncbi:MAG TPA: AAA family ATPase [Dehalococcoidia bacterium]|nr:AAA family ATPase [Dehalococcoidia bacterium]